MNACVSAFQADDQASDTNGFGPVHSGLATGGDVFGQTGGYGGCGRRRIRRKDFTNLCQKSWVTPTSPHKVPLRSRRCKDTYGELEGSS